MSSTDEKRDSRDGHVGVAAPMNPTDLGLDFPGPSYEISPRPIHGWKWVIGYISILSVTFLFALDNTIVAAIQPSILESFGEVQLLSWIGVAFALGSTAILGWGKAYGVFDIKTIFISNIVLFEIGSAVCGAAPNMRALIVGRVVAGVGGCGMYSGGLSYIASLTSLKERPMYTAGIAVLWGLGSVLGPVVGGGFAISSATWRWPTNTGVEKGFYINLVIGAVFAPSYLFLLPRVDLQPGKSFSQKLGMIDWLGNLVFVAGSTCLIMAIAFSGSEYAWDSGSSIALWVMSGVLLIVMVMITIRPPFVTKENRLVPAHFFRNPVLLNLGVQMFLVSGVMLAAVYYIPLFFAFSRGDGVMDAGIRLLPYVCLMVFGSILSGALLPKTGYYMPWYVVGAMLTTIGSALMTTVRTDTSIANVYGYTILVGFGSGLYVVAGFAVTQSLTPVEDVASSVGFQAIAQVLGSVVFLSVSGNIFFNTGTQAIRAVLPADTPAPFVADLIAGSSSAAFESLSQYDGARVIDAITSSMRNVWIFYLAATALSFVLSFFLGRKKLEIAAA
ncbi:azole resistance protein 1 [Apiospora rasikravindrae]|uniref:Azole resistance protein 1 n=1 Tax=Apiospora rasikravindrae TaxID=990691 RepID=A0ABR1SK09_9PEZI